MQKEDLLRWLDSSPPIQELKKFAKSMGLRVRKAMKKRDVIRIIRERLEESERVSSTPIPFTTLSVSIPHIELPKTYNKDKLVLMPVNPRLAFVYWDLSENTRNLLSQKVREGKAIIRLYDVSFVSFNGKNAHRTFEYRLDENTLNAKNFYFNVPSPKAVYLSEMGYLEGEVFVSVLRSNLVRTPSDSPSSSSRERWIDLRSKRRWVSISKGSLIKPVEKLSVLSSYHEISSGAGIGRNAADRR